ncbi:MAG: oligopeptide/dipeptide ABC transporter ATP-binding protein [Oscillospiraceae bacterium]
MYLGSICEYADTAEFFENPRHPYTQMLLASIPVLSDEEERLKPQKIKSIGEIPSPLNKPKGCPFHPRCPFKKDICSQDTPQMRGSLPGHFACCHLHLREMAGSGVLWAGMPGPKRLITRKKQGEPKRRASLAPRCRRTRGLVSAQPRKYGAETLFPPLLGGKNKAECVSHTKALLFFFARVFGLLTDKGRSIAEAMLLPLFPRPGAGVGPWVWARRRNPEYRRASATCLPTRLLRAHSPRRRW